MIDKTTAVNAHHRQEFFHTSGKRARVNGKCQTWKTRPADFRLPMKYGLKECFYIDNSNAAEWSSEPPVSAKDAETCAKDMLDWMSHDNDIPGVELAKYLKPLTEALKKDCANGQPLPSKSEREEFVVGEFSSQNDLSKKWPETDKILDTAFDGGNTGDDPPEKHTRACNEAEDDGCDGKCKER